MREPIFVRPISNDERKALEEGLRSSDAFVLRRCQILLASSRGERAPRIARTLGCNDQTVRNAIHAFNDATGPEDALGKGSSRPRTIHAAFDGGRAEKLREMLHQSPRRFGKPTSLWTLELAAEVSFEEGLTEGQVTGETVRATLERLGVRWLRAKRWITSQDPEYERKRRRDRLMRLAGENPGWAVGFEDEVWWSRFALPSLCAWSADGEPLRLVQHSVAKDDPNPKAISCYGLYLPELKETWLRFVDGRPVSGITTQFLSWCSEKLVTAGKRVLVLVWNNASWHKSKELRRWIGEHNREVKKGNKEGVRIIGCLLPKQSPWLNPIEPKKWMHGKRRIAEADGPLSAHELAERVCSAFDCLHHEHLSLA